MVMPLGLALYFANKTTHSGMSRDFFCLGDVGLNFPEFTGSVSYPIVSLLMFCKNNMSHTWGNKHAN